MCVAGHDEVVAEGRKLRDRIGRVDQGQAEPIGLATDGRVESDGRRIVRPHARSGVVLDDDR